jgi:hypothetical protein
LIKTGTYLDLVLFALITATSYYYWSLTADPEWKPFIRHIAALDAIKEGVGKSVEENKPVHFAMGASGGQMYSTLVSMTLTALAFLRYVAGLCADYGARLIVHMPYQTESIPLIEGTCRDGYVAAGAPEQYRRDDMRYYGRGALSWTQGVTASYAEEGVGLNLSVGIFYSDCPISLEMAHIMGGLNVGGTGRWIMVYAFAMMCDYVFLGEEIYAAAAQISENKMMLSGILIEEVGKFAVLALLVIGVILQAVGLNFVGMLAL